MTKYTWRGAALQTVAPLIPTRCYGCLFANDDVCPHNAPDIDFNCDATCDIIFIKDTPEAMAEYVAKKLEDT